MSIAKSARTAHWLKLSGPGPSGATLLPGSHAFVKVLFYYTTLSTSVNASRVKG